MIIKLITRCFCGVPTRFTLAIMGFFAVINAYTMRICLSTAITEMVVKIYHNSSIANNDVCEAPDSGQSQEQSGGHGTFEWDEEFQGIILGSFYWGYVLTHIPGGILAERFGGKWPLGLGILSTALFTLITPLATQLGGGWALIAVRFLEGLGEGTTFPALNAMLAQWIPVKERSKAGALVFGGAQIGTIFANLISGLLLHSIEGWSSPFYFFGAMGVIWFFLFVILCYNDPESHPYISEREKIYLMRELGALERDKTLPPTPWWLILSSPPMISLVICQIGHDFGYFTMITDLPKYMSDILRFNIKENGMFSSLPYVLMWFVSLGSGILSDWLITKQYISVTNSRKVFTTFASAGPAIFILAASYAGCDRTLAVVFFIIAMGFMGAYYSGMKVNALDLSPNYAGGLMAITNGIAALTGIISPYLVGVLTPDRTLIQWRTVFWIAFGVFMVTNLVYIMWASGKVQPWNTPHLMNQESNNNELQNKENTTSDSKEKDNKI